jgi:hypothetical protein
VTRGPLAAHVGLAAVTLTIAACQAKGRADAVPDSSAAAVGADAKGPATPDWRVVEWEPYAGVDPGDLGRGVVFLTHAEDKGAPPGTADTLLLRTTPNDGAPAIGAMVFSVGASGITRYAIATTDSLRPNLVEHGYEESGVPFDSSDASGRWLRGTLGFAADGSPRTGWIDSSQPGVGVIRWAQHLADRPIFFPRPDGAAFFATADSATPVRAPRGGEDSYAIHPVETRGPWMRVRLVTPSDNCAESESAQHRTRTVWIRYLDDRGRPNVWYYTRGC